jgi:hypothetical protein
VLQMITGIWFSPDPAGARRADAGSQDVVASGRTSMLCRSRLPSAKSTAKVPQKGRSAFAAAAHQAGGQCCAASALPS